MFLDLIIITLISTTVLLFISKKTTLLKDIKNQRHKKYVSKKNNHILGGIIFIIFWFFYIFFDQKIISNELKIYSTCLLLFIIGLFSDLKILENPKKRFFLQLFALYFLIQFFNFTIPISNIQIIDFFLNNNYFNKFFTIFCLMILINGYNFVDGINTLLIGYNLTISLILLIFFKENLHDVGLLKYFMTIMIILLIFNFNGNLILGDSGSYAIGLFIGIYLITFAANNPYLSPFLVISLIWYPCFELLFSMIRRFKSKRKMYKPDTNHYHQLLFKFFNIRERNNLICHMYVSLTINFYCLFILSLNIFFGLKTSQIFLFLILNIFIYLITYKKLLKKI